MGLVKGLLTLPLAPVRGTVWIADQIASEAERQLYDEANIRREMMELELEEGEGRVSMEERAAREQQLLDRLAIARERAEAEAMEQAEPQEEGSDNG